MSSQAAFDELSLGTVLRPHPADLPLSGRHYRVSRQALTAKAVVTVMYGMPGSPSDAVDEPLDPRVGIG